MKPKVWVGLPLLPEPLALLARETDVILNPSLGNLPGVEAVILGLEPFAGPEFMDTAGPALKIIARHGIGLDNVDIPAATARGILVVNTPDAPTESTAEHAVALLLAVAKRVVAADMSLRGSEIPKPQLMGTEVRGRVLGIIGCGRVGRRVARICGLGLEMRIMTYDPHCADWGEVEGLVVEAVDSLDELLTRADFVTLHAALTPETQHLIGERELRLMKPGSYLINTSRGPVVDETALVQALTQGHLAGAGLDVFDPEPPAPDHPLFRLTNVVVTPHIASFTDMGFHGMATGVVEQILQVFHGERPAYLVNPAAWPGRVEQHSE